MPHQEYFWAAVLIAGLLAAILLVRLFVKQRGASRGADEPSAAEADLAASSPPTNDQR